MTLRSSCYSDPPSDQCEEESTLHAHILHSGAPGADLAAQDVVEDLGNVLLGLGTER